MKSRRWLDGAAAGALLAAAVANALEDALGVRVTQAPLTPERVLSAIREQRPEPVPRPSALTASASL